MVATKTRRAEPTEHAQAAKQIRAALKRAYPRITFSVRSESFAGGDAVRITWIDGPTTEAVEKIANQHEYGRFDGMQDLYEYTNVRDDIPQVKYVSTCRSKSREAHAALLAIVNTHWGWTLQQSEHGPWVDNAADWEQRVTLERAWQHLSLVCPACGSPTLPGDRFCPDCGASLPAEDR